MTNHNSLVQMLAHGLRVPVLLMKYGEAVLSIPDPYETAALLITGALIESITPAADQPGIVQYLDSPYLESFLYTNPEPGIEIWLGPFLRNPLRERDIAHMIREQGAPLSSQDRLMQYYSHRQVLSDRQYYYLGKLLQQLVGQGDHSVLPEAVPDTGPTRVFPYSRISGAGSEQIEHSPYFIEMEMVRLVTCGDLNGALDTMKRINTYPRAVLADDAVRSLKNSIICNCTFLARAAITGGVPFSDAFSLSDRLIWQIEHTKSIPQLEELERNILMEFVALVDSYNSTHYSQPIRDVISYINQNLSEKLTLRELAERVSLHPNYLSLLFRKETGCVLSRYILGQRIEEAKFYLRYTSDPIADISSFYQFSSQSHFIQKFSQFTGVTPLQYRKMAKADYTVEASK